MARVDHHISVAGACDIWSATFIQIWVLSHHAAFLHSYIPFRHIYVSCWPLRLVGHILLHYKQVSRFLQKGYS